LGETKEVFLLYVQHFTQQGILILEPTKKNNIKFTLFLQ
jgi:hypothetical protein